MKVNKVILRQLQLSVACANFTNLYCLFLAGNLSIILENNSATSALEQQMLISTGFVYRCLIPRKEPEVRGFLPRNINRYVVVKSP